jgi:site-specific DNA-methyltransferase (adenine-specific)
VIYYQDENVTLYHGDCRGLVLPNASVDLLLTDPPYGIGYKARGTHPMIAGDEDNAFVKDALRGCLKALRINRHFYVFGPDVVSDLTVCPTVELIWDKGRLSAGGSMDAPWSSGHERITFGLYSPYKSHRNVGHGAVKMRRSSIIKVPKISNGRGSFVHPNQKPVELMRVLIEASSHFDEVVYDPFAGSGPTLVAAVEEGRRAIGCEIDERYCEVIAKRLSTGDRVTAPARVQS